MVRATFLFVLMHVFCVDNASFCVPQTLTFGNCLLINSSSYVHLYSCSSHLLMPALGTDSFIKITCDWQGTCNRFFPTTIQIIDDSLFSVTLFLSVSWCQDVLYQGSYRYVKLGCGLNLCCYEESYHEPRYATHYQHECIIESSVLLSVILVAWAFKGNESSDNLNPA